MDWIKADIDSKKRALSTVIDSNSTSSDAPANKYIKRGDLEKLRVAQAKEDAELEAKERADRKGKKVDSGNTGGSKDNNEGKEGGEVEEIGDTEKVVTTEIIKDKSDGFMVTNPEAIRRLRAKGQPILLFGETDKDRRLRLRALELIEERTEGQRNDFMKAMDGMEKGLDMDAMANQVGGAASNTAGEREGGEKVDRGKMMREENVEVEVGLVKSNPHKVYPQIYHALKRILKEWEQSMTDRPEAVKRSTQGKIAAATQQTSAEYLKPLFKSLRKRDLAPDVLQAIAEITYNMQIREYIKANDAYLRLSIGNAPWPIGVTMVGIHERSGREKIFSNNVAHVLNDETSRKYIQSVKRLMTYCQTVYPPSDLANKMG